ncbi:MAG: T9SS type A sorting domain-containing protein, partial [Bacteroidia bacterium]|nr:T9SS type A sorting domain-containing protein [Bacteroidia bacterium]
QSITPSGGGGKGGDNLTTQSVFNIPVVVHVIHNNEPINSISANTGNNLNAAQIIDQINILNKDFNGTNSDTNLIPTAFKPLLGKFKVNFCLAVVNPTGGVMAEPGIDRINRIAKGWTAPPYSSTYCSSTIKPQSIWDVNKYFNIWVCGLSGGLLGFATFPDPATSGLSGLSAPYGNATSDGVVILNTAFGSIGTGTTSPPYDRGRTATHEVGHWIGLRHIWGDGSCANDFCNDTPVQSNATYNCPSYPNASGCAASPNPPGRMFMNFMDYTNDACMYMFSKDQAYRAQLIMVNSPIRKSLLTSTVCNLPSVTNDLGIMYISSPTYSQVISCDNFINPVIIIKNFGSNMITSATFTYNVNGVGTQTFNWSGNLAANSQATVNLPTVNSVPNGTNGLNVGLTTVNAGSDSNSSNNFNSQMFITQNGFSISASGAATVCAGGSATLTASGSATGYTWNPGAIAGTIAVVNPASSTIYTLSGNSGTCITTRTVQVTVSATPTVAVSNQTICTGGTATLSASGASTYSWSTSQTTSSITVSPASNTTYTVTGFIGSCINTKTVSVTIGTALGINVSATSTVFCSGGSTTITANGASTYTWSTSSNNASIAVSPIVTTIYTVNGTAGSCSGSKTIAITVNTTPTINPSTATPTICNGTNVTLNVSGANNYTWNPGNLTGASVNVLPSSTTVYTVLGTTPAGCSDVKTLTVTVNAKPFINVASSSNTVCTGGNMGLFANGASTYTWNPGNQAGSSVTVNPTSTTVYTCVGSAANGCTDTKTITITVVPCVGLADITGNSVSVTIYPNPFKNELNINSNEEVSVVVFNALGQNVMKETVSRKGSINTESLANGIYFIHIKGLNGTKIFKVVKN